MFRRLEKQPALRRSAFLPASLLCQQKVSIQAVFSLGPPRLLASTLGIFLPDSTVLAFVLASRASEPHRAACVGH